MFEHWIALPEILRRHARHYRTGAPIPEALIERLVAARTFNQGFATVEYVAAALIDLELHEAPPEKAADLTAFERQFLSAIGMPREIGLRHRLPHFQHLFAGGGYAAGYYAYLWAEVLDADGFAAFGEKGDPFDPEVAARLAQVYGAGDTRDPMDLYRAFRGRDPQIAPLLAQRGLDFQPGSGARGTRDGDRPALTAVRRGGSRCPRPPRLPRCRSPRCCRRTRNSPSAPCIQAGGGA